MALTAVRGHYRNGQVVLDEIPSGIAEAEVLVIFAPAEAASEKRAEAIQRMVQQMREGFPIGGKGYTQREELYAERLDRYGNSNG